MTTTSSSARAPVRAVELDVRTNALNLVRLVLAFLVLVAHGFYIAGDGTGPSFRGENLGGWAVFGFFTLSGYLITASRLANNLGPYLVHRVARIFPGFLVCLVVTAGVFAPIAWWVDHHSLAGFLSTPTTPVHYVLDNSLLHITAYDVAGTPADVPYPGAWNGSLWTLVYEFSCYLLIGLVLCLPVVRRRPTILVGLFVTSVAVWALTPTLIHNPEAELLARLVPPFLGGATVQVLIHRIPLQHRGAGVATVAAAAAVWFIPHWGAQAAAPLVAYVLLWVGAVLPSPELIRRHDISYGAYVYAFPVSQLLAVAGAYRLGVVILDLAAVAVTTGLATLSWRLVERPAMRRARRLTRR
ncbi:MAG: acyltransferase [Lapillicoccus sp.]